MNSKAILFAAGVFVTAAGSTVAIPAFAAEKSQHAHDHEPMHGGIVVETRDMDYELVASSTMLQLYLRDHGEPANVANASAKVTLLAGTVKQEVELRPVGDRLEAVGNFNVGPGAKVVAVVLNGGKLAGTVRFSIK